MITKVLSTVRKNNMLCGGRVLVALSGGMDSSVMLDVLFRLREDLGISVCAAHLNHMLRGEDALADEAFCKEKCEKYGIDFISERMDVAKTAKEAGESVELCARNVRYAFLHRAKEALSATYIATAHNANDNLETILFNLSRGSGISGMCGIPYTREDIIRPMIECTRSEIEAYAKKNGIEFCIDKTNAETEYSRNKLRHFAVPTLLDLNAAAIENATRASSILRMEAEFIERAAKKYLSEISKDGVSCGRHLLTSEPALLSRVCESLAATALGKKSYTLEHKHIEMILSLAESENPSGKLSLPDGLRVSRRYEEILFARDVDEETPAPIFLQEGKNLWRDFEINVKKVKNRVKIHNLLNTFFVPYDKIQDSLIVRSRKEGDEIKLDKRKTKTIKKLFIDEKLPSNERDTTPVIADIEKVFGVFGFGADCRNSEGTGGGYLIEIIKK